jgi:hypothetical protein
MPPGVSLPPYGVAPEAIKDPETRALYEVALKRRKEKIARISELSNLSRWMKIYPRLVEPFIVENYSKPPYAVAELKSYLGQYDVEEEMRARIVAEVEKRTAEQTRQETGDEEVVAAPRTPLPETAPATPRAVPQAETEALEPTTSLYLPFAALLIITAAIIFGYVIISGRRHRGGGR